MGGPSRRLLLSGLPDLLLNPAVTIPAPDADLEWLLTDGVGGYACGTAADLATRRYHALWISRLPGAAKRYLWVAGLDERVGPAAAGVSLLHAHWANLPAPSPPPVAVEFQHRPWPRWTFRGSAAGGHGPFAVERSVLLQRATAQQPPALLVRWRNLGDGPTLLRVRVLLGCHDADQLPPADEGFDGTVQVRGASWGVRPRADLPTLWLEADGLAAFESAPAWYRGFHYRVDRERGYDHVGDRWSPGVLELSLGPGQDAVLACSLEQPLQARPGSPSPAELWEVAAETAEATAAMIASAAEPAIARLAASGRDFFYRADGDRLGVLAGFPWFGEWGRDVFLALPGLTLPQGDLARCAEVLDGALPFLRRGLLPNIYAATVADSHYGSCDAALWWSLAAQRLEDAAGELPAARLTALRSIADAYLAGTDLGMQVDGDGLLQAGSESLNATWMDARTAAGPVTPRAGLPVEIQALWYALLDRLVAAGHADLAATRDRCGKAFLRQFWLPAGYLADRVQHGRPDPAVRPNMVLAAALPRSPLSRAQRDSVAQKAAAELVTPRGLRTLSPLDPAYRGRYEGGIDSRDAAYHQGTVWPWLAGFYVEAALRGTTKARLAERRAALRTWLLAMLAELDRAGLDHLSEVFDGDAPHRPGGTIAQAWSTAEVLRGLWLCDHPPAAAKARP